MWKTILLSLICAGCCACPPTPDQWDVDLGTSAIEWASSDTVGAVYDLQWFGYLDSMTTASAELPGVDVATVAGEVHGPWPCRWIHYAHEECCLEPEPITRYRVDGDKVTIIDQYIPAVAITYTVRDSVWHCGGDGEFRK